MFDEEVTSEVIEEESRREEADYLGEEEIDIGNISVSEIELFLTRAEIWNGLLQNRITINEALDSFPSSKSLQETTKKVSKRSRKRKS
ncbi:MAG: hypothetical protein QW101_02195 [Ignisphaera sp.]|uniref:RNA polymerase Rpo13 subunit HTH domain-containing protein n=1 Tax=Ignisphaera aggregans TaxID=334771 RepID=A0A7J3MYR6_9CREN